MVTKDFSWAARDTRSFDERFLGQIKKNFPQTCENMKNGWNLSSEQEERLFKFAQTSSENNLAYYMHILKYAGKEHKFKLLSGKKVSDFMEGLYTNKRLSQSVEYYEDGISAFLKGNNRALRAFTQFCNSWDVSSFFIARASQSDDSDTGHDLM